MSMLSDKTVARLDLHLMTMRIIHAALAMGVLVFAIVALAAGRFEMKPAAQPIDWMMAGIGVAFGIAGWIVPRLIPQPNPSGGSVDETTQALSVAAGVQTALIIGCAIFEGGAFANLVRYYTDHIWLNLAVAGVLWLLLLMQFPRRGALLDRVERRLRELREEQALTAARR